VNSKKRRAASGQSRARTSVLVDHTHLESAHRVELHVDSVAARRARLGHGAGVAVAHGADVERQGHRREPADREATFGMVDRANRTGSSSVAGTRVSPRAHRVHESETSDPRPARVRGDDGWMGVGCPAHQIPPGAPMPIRDSLLPELDQELATTRKLLAAVPEAKTAFRPHAKSWTLGELSLHLANLLTWLPSTLKATELDLSPPGGQPFTPPRFESAAATLRMFDETSRAARAALASASDAELMVPWTLKRSGQALFTMPRLACVRSFVMNHLIHHRGQLTVYLRLCDVPLPPVYGPTADVTGDVLAKQAHQS